MVVLDESNLRAGTGMTCREEPLSGCCNVGKVEIIGGA